MLLEKLSFGIGDRFGREGKVQLMAIQEINRSGVPVVPVWNKSNREHELVGTGQESVKEEADQAVKELNWKNSYYIDADHITLSNVDKFLEYSNFFTLDVAHSIGKPTDPLITKDFIDRNKDSNLMTADSGWSLPEFCDQFLSAVYEVKRLYDYISLRNPEGFVPEVSMDEVAVAQSPTDLYFILKELKYLGVEVQTIAPKFTGLFPKGVDYEGDVEIFARELEQDILMLKRASDEFGLPENLKLSIHSGSDKFSIYPAIRELVKKHNVGIHIKTAGTTWLEEVIGLARGGGEGLRIAKEIYSQGIARFDELAGPYATVLHINKDFLPPVKDVLAWSSARFAHTLIHDQLYKDYNPHFRQLIHIAYKVAAGMGSEFLGALDYYRAPIEEQVYTNLVERHLRRVF